MVAHGKTIHADIFEFLKNLAIDARAAGAIFAVCNHKINPVTLQQLGKPALGNMAAGATHNIANKQYFHGKVPTFPFPRKQKRLVPRRFSFYLA